MIINGMLVAATVNGVQYVLVSDGRTDYTINNGCDYGCAGGPTYKDINTLTEADKAAAQAYVKNNPVRA